MHKKITGLVIQFSKIFKAGGVSPPGTQSCKWKTQFDQSD